MLLISILATLLLTLRIDLDPIKPKTISHVFNTLLLGVFVSIAFSSHPNALFFLPVFIYCGFKTLKNTIFAVASSLICIAYAFDTLGFMTLYTSCPQDPGLRQIMAQMAMSPRILFSDPHTFFLILIANLSRIFEYVQSILYSGQYPFGWIPRHPIDILNILVNILTTCTWIAIFALAVLGVVRTAPLALKSRKSSTLTNISLLLTISLIGNISLQSLKNWYSSILILPLIAILLSLVFQTILALHEAKHFKKYFLWIQAIAFFSMITNLITFSGSAATEWLTPGAQVENGLAFSGFGYAAEIKKIQRAAAQCNLSPGVQYNRLVVDDLTYWLFKETKSPIHAFYVSGSIYASSIKSLELFLRERQSDGIVTRCNEIKDPSLQKIARRFDQYC